MSSFTTTTSTTTTSSSGGAAHLAGARYGKDKVRVLRVVRGDRDGPRWHDVVEYNVCALVEGEIETSFTQADNSVVVATDSIKNMVYYLAKTSPFILKPETFALHVGAFILGRYAHLKKAFVDVEVLRWERIAIDGKAHGHAFWRDGEEKRVVKTEIVKKGEGLEGTVKAGLLDLLVIKTTGSAFENFVRDEFTTLVEVNDRIFSTAVDLEYTFAGPVSISLTPDGKVVEESLTKVKGALDFDTVAKRAREITLRLFAEDESASVQATLYKMGVAIVEEFKQVEEVRYALPNKHYVPVDMKYINVDNTSPAQAEVFVPLAAPSGLIRGAVSREMTSE